MHPIIKLSREPAELLSTSTNIELIASGSFPSFRSSLTLYWSVSCRYKHTPPPLFLIPVILFHVIIWKVIVNMMSFNSCLRYSYGLLVQNLTQSRNYMNSRK